MFRLAAAVLLSVLAAHATHAEQGWLDAAEYGDVTVVVATDAPADERLAAEEFQYYWERSTGHRPVIAHAVSPGPDVLIGAAFAGTASVAGLGDDGLLIQSTPAGDLLICGESARGTLNGVYEFFERYLGVRWLTWEVTHVPAAPESLPAIDYRYVPPFRFRWTNTWYGAGDARTSFIRAHRLREPRFGGGFGHNFLTLVPGPEYFADHPEYFGMNPEGERVTVDTWEAYNAPVSERGFDDVWQLCMSNPDVPGVIMEKLRQWHDQSPGADFWCVMQEDTDNHCHCPECKAIDAREGTPMGSMLTGINRVAERWAEAFPNKNLMTYAYAYTRTPPKTLRPHDNLHILLCTIECDFLRPIGPDSSEENVKFYRDLQDWARLTGNLMVYDYAPNFAAWLRPHPNLHVIVPNLKTYAANHVQGVFVQGDALGCGGFPTLRGYLIARGLWNPDVDHAAAMDEFLTLYFAESAPYLREYIALMTQTALDKNALVTCFDDGTWMDAAFLNQAAALMREALAAASSDEIRRRVKREWLAVQYAGLVNGALAERAGDAYVVTRPSEIDAGEFLDACREMGVVQLDEQYGRSGVPIEDSVREHLGPLGVRRPREEYPVLTLENKRFVVEILPEYSGAIVRYADKEWGNDVFRGATSLETERWMLQEWTTRSPGQPLEEPLWSEYRVVETSRNHVTLETRLASGLTMRRTASLPPGDAPLEVTWELINGTAEPQTPHFKVHPEFWTGGRQEPEIWIEQDGSWKERPVVRLGDQSFGGEVIDPAGISRWAARIPHQRQTVTVGIAPGDWEALFYFFSTKKEQVNLELIPNQAPLAPGETRLMRASYQLGRRLP